jgi:tRNA isopentenyl-2-thiomethyl-A-37 hydroxylase MiaE
MKTGKVIVVEQLEHKELVRAVVQEHARAGRVNITASPVGSAALEIIRANEPFAFFGRKQVQQLPPDLKTMMAQG